MRVRQATPEDLPHLVALFDELARMQREWRVFTPRPGFYDEVHDKYLTAMRNADALVVVAEAESEEGGGIIGMAYGEIHTPSRFSDERALEISGVAVRSGHRGRGVGRALVAEATRFAEDRGVNWIELKTFAPNETAMEFWRTLGFTPRVVQLIAQTAEVAQRSSEVSQTS